MKVTLMNFVQKSIVSAIEKYQSEGGSIEKFRIDCNFEPGCSEYAKKAVIRFGVKRGLILSFQRLKKCNARDQVLKVYDPVPSDIL